tara:strand:- start:5788 stop:6633 length:846 start_codon:yes stop_codon:yes gene_type:complete
MVKSNKKSKANEDLNIYPIKIDDDKLNNGGDGNNYPLNNPVHLHLICGRVKSGKSVLLNNMYLSSRFFGDEYKTKILISTTAHNDAINKFMLEDFDFIFTDYTDELLQEIMDIIKEDEGDGRFLIIFDDIINSGQGFKRSGKTDLLTQIITTYRHIGNGEFEGKLAMAIAVQYFKYLSPIARNNCSGYYIMGHFPESEVKKMSESLSIFGRDDKGFRQIYKHSRQKPYDFLYLSIEHMEARRNHNELLWSEKTGFTFNKDKNDNLEMDTENKLEEVEENND